MNLREANSRWRTGVMVILIAPMIGTVLRASESPTWATVVGVAAMVALVALGSSLVFWRGAGPVGWTPSATLPRTEQDDR